MSNDIYQIYLQLEDSDPPIWRRFLVDPKTPVEDLHKIIQTVMGWTNSHLHHFLKDGNRYAVPHEDDWDTDSLVDYTGLKISDLLHKENDTILYEYDFGDCWMHLLKLEKIVPRENGKYYPLCIDGKMNCPPEDSGGIGGCYHILKIIGDPDHPEFEDMNEWMPEDFDPEHFDLEEINSMLQEEDYGCIICYD